MLNALTESQNKTAANEANDEHLLNLFEIWQMLKNSWPLVAWITSICICLAFLLTLIIPKQWEAKATLRIGQVQSDTGELKLVEDPLQTVERTKLMGFKKRILMDLHLPTEVGTDDRTDLLLSSFKGSGIKNTAFINISARGYSADDAVNILIACTQELKKTHALMIEPIKKRILQESQATNESLSQASQQLTRLNKQMPVVGNNPTSSAFAASIVAINLLAVKEAEVRTLKADQIKYSAMLASFDEQATSIVSSIDITNELIFPKRSVFLLLGGFFGLLLSLGIALWKNKD
jgi:capsular polysaccharide biosynthesis protein